MVYAMILIFDCFPELCIHRSRVVDGTVLFGQSSRARLNETDVSHSNAMNKRVNVKVSTTILVNTRAVFMYNNRNRGMSIVNSELNVAIGKINNLLP